MLFAKADNAKRRKKVDFYQFKSKQPINTNTNELMLKLKHQVFYLSKTTLTVGDSVINSIIEERINKEDTPVKVRNIPGAIVTG